MAVGEMVAMLDYETWKPLLIFFDLETTGPSPYRDCIIEIGAIARSQQIEISKPTFSRLVKPPSRISPLASSVHGLHDNDLTNEGPFSKIFTQFLSWIKTIVADVTEHTGVNHYPVLAAHNGYNFDFPCLFSEISRNMHEMGFQQLTKNKVHFFDTLRHLRQLKKMGSIETLNNLKSFRLQSLHETYLPNEEYKGHRALTDAENTAHIFMETEIHSTLSHLQARCFEEQELNWMDKVLGKDLQEHFKISTYQQKRLIQQGFTCEHLKELFIECQHDEDEFKKILHTRKINSAQLCDKLAMTLLDELSPQ